MIAHLSWPDLAVLLAAALPPSGPGTAADSPAPRLVDVAAERGLEFVHETGRDPLQTIIETTGPGACVLDADGDGDDDLFLVSGGRPGEPDRRPSRLFRNDGGRFVDVTAAAGVGGRGYGLGCASADVDGDGDADLLVTNHGADELYLNDGRGGFAEVATVAGVADPRWTTSAAFADADGDGDLDLFVGAYADVSPDAPRCAGPAGLMVLCRPTDYPALPSRLYRNDGVGGDGLPRFTDVTTALGVDDGAGRTLGVLFEDLDGDDLPDLYLANDMTRNVLLLRREEGFVDRTLLAGVGLSEAGIPEAGMGVDAGDVDGDGRPELVVTNFQLEANTVYRGLDGARWRDVTRSSGVGAATFLPLGFGVNLLDVDLNGDLDLFFANGHVDDRVGDYDERTAHAQPDQLFRNPGTGRGRLRFEDVSRRSLVAPARVGRGSAWLDLEGDGDLDLVVASNGGSPLLYENRTPRGSHHWLAIRLEGRPPNRDGIGALVTVRLPNGSSQQRRVRTTSSLFSSSPPRAHFGLGAGTRALVAVRWPDGLVQELGALPVDRLHVVRRPAGAATTGGGAAGKDGGS